ncbi:MAG TPA: PAS domain-containing protein, partial [Allosphingosinicella sp.]|nr:PAS domain-containing protein [Allosphingosinicella sp.]
MTEEIELEGERHDDLGVMRQRLELAIEGAQLGIWSFNPRTEALWWSDRSKALFALDDNFIPDARALKARIHPDDWERIAAPYYGDGFGDEPLAVEYRIVLPDGETRWIYALGAAARGEDGVATAVHGIHLDVTQRKRSEEMLDETRRQLGMALESAELGTWTIDPNSGEVWYSDRSRELYGVEPDAPIDVRTLKRLIHPDDWPRVNEPYLLGFPSDTISIEHRVLRPDGETYWVYSRGAALRDENGALVMLSGIHMDITGRKRAEEELARSRDALMQSEKLAAMGAMLAGVSHELNNPLAAIVGQSEMLHEDAVGTPFEERARKIGAAAERCARIVQTFLAMARRRETQRELVNLNDVIASSLEITEYALRTAGVAVRVNFGTGLPAVEGDRDQLHQVLVNLIVNAQQAMEKGEAFEKVLTVRTSVDQAGRILIDVSDSGPGIPEAMRRRIFEPFFTTKR